VDSLTLRRLVLVAIPALVVVAVAVAVTFVLADSSSDNPATSSDRPGVQTIPAVMPIPEGNRPLIGDHWHAPYVIFIGNTRQPNIPSFTGPEETHTHGEGVIHMHPFIPAGEGLGASLRKFFEYGGGKLTDDELKIPGQKETHKDGEQIDGKAAELRILRADSGIHPLGAGFARAIQSCDAKDESTFERVDSRYIPKDGDCIRIVFAAPDAKPEIKPDRTVIPPEEATGTIEMDVTGDATPSFSPASISVEAGETIAIVLSNRSRFEKQTFVPFHGLRFSGADRQYGTSDDYVTETTDSRSGRRGHGGYPL